MNELPRRPIPPLPPPPGQFDRVLAAAHSRRRHRALRVSAVVGVFLAGIAGGLSINTPVTEVPQAIVDLANGDAPGNTDPTVQSQAASVTPNATPTRRRPPSTTPAPETSAAIAIGPVAPTVRTLRGRAVNPEGAPVAGLFVYPGKPGSASFVPSADPVAVTAANGEFRLPCTGAPVLLSPWPLNQPAGEFAGKAEWAPTFVGGATHPGSAAVPRCGPKQSMRTVVVQRGSALTGDVTVSGTCQEPTDLTVRLFGRPNLRVTLAGLVDGGSYRLGGLPPGEHTVVVGDQEHAVVAGGMAPQAYDLQVPCDLEPSPTPTPTVTPEPSSSASPSPQPDPTDPTPSLSPNPSPSANTRP